MFLYLIFNQQTSLPPLTPSSNPTFLSKDQTNAWISVSIYYAEDWQFLLFIHSMLYFTFSPLKIASSGPLHTRGWEPMTIPLQALSWVKNAEPVQVRFTPLLRDQRSMWVHDECKVYMDSYMALNGSCFMVAWTVFKSHFLEVGLTQNRETMALRTYATVGLFYLIMCEDPHE